MRGRSTGHRAWALSLTVALLAGCGDDVGADDAYDARPGDDVGGDSDAEADDGLPESEPDEAALADGDDVPVDGPGETPLDGAEPVPGTPLFEAAGMFEALIPGHDDPADVYYPTPADLAPGAYSFPVALLLQGANVDKAAYAGFASLVARYGFIVVVPNHSSSTMLGTGLYVEASQLGQTLDFVRAQNDDPGSPLLGVVDAGSLVLLGHSYGGVAGVNAIRGACQPPSCSLGWTRPEELRGGAFYGTNLRTPLIGTIPNIDNGGRPLALVQGTRDSKAPPGDAQATYDKIQDPPKAIVMVEGANHYGLCDVNDPPGAGPDGTPPTLDQDLAVETAARWSAIFLRARVLGDPSAIDYLESLGDPVDPNATVTWE